MLEYIIGMVLVGGLSFLLGIIYAERRIQRKISTAARKSLGDNTFLVGDAIGHFQSLMILEKDQIEDILLSIRDETGIITSFIFRMITQIYFSKEK